MISSIYSASPSITSIAPESFSQLDQQLITAMQALDFKAAARFIEQGANPNQLINITPEMHSIITDEMLSEKISFTFIPCPDCGHHDFEMTLSQSKLPAYLIGLIYGQHDFISTCSNYNTDLKLQIIETIPDFIEILFASSLLNQDFERTKLFMQLGFTLSTPLYEGYLGTAFSLALTFNDVQAIKFCLDEGEDAKTPISVPITWGEQSINPMWQIFEPFPDILACFSGAEDQIESLFKAREEVYFLLKEQGADMKVINDENQNLLVPAIYSLSPKIAQDLIKSEVGDINHIDKEGLTPLDHALLSLKELREDAGSLLDLKNFIPEAQEMIKVLTQNGAVVSKKAL